MWVLRLYQRTNGVDNQAERLVDLNQIHSCSTSRGCSKVPLDFYFLFCTIFSQPAVFLSNRFTSSPLDRAAKFLFRFFSLSSSCGGCHSSFSLAPPKRLAL